MSRLVNGVEFFNVEHGDFTVEYDLFMNKYLRDTGVLACLQESNTPKKIKRVIQTPTGPVEVDAEELTSASKSAQLITALEQSPLTPRLLAGLLKLQPEPWTQERSVRTEMVITACSKPADKVVLFELLLSNLNTFFSTRQTILDDFPMIMLKGVTGRITEREPPETRGFRQYGQWDEPLRVLAGYNPDIVGKELHWHLRDFLLAFEHYQKQRAADGYRDAMKIYAVLAPYAKKGKLRPPKIPRILRGRRSHGNNQE